MATVPQNIKINSKATTADLMNNIRSTASPAYQAAVPYVDMSVDGVRALGAGVMSTPDLKNEFLSALFNRIAIAVIKSKLYNMPWGFTKKGVLETGEFIEEIFVEICDPHQYNSGEDIDFIKQEKPDVRAVLHSLNYQKYYKQTINNRDLKLAFLSWDGVDNLIAKITDNMYTSANYDEFLAIKYMIGQAILGGNIYSQSLGNVTTTENLEDAVAGVREISNLMTFEGTEYNTAGVHNFTLRDNQYVFLSANFDARTSVKVLAKAFNMSEAEFMGHVVLVDSFGRLDVNRLNLLFADDPNYSVPSEDELQALDAVPGVIVDIDWFIIYDNLLEFTEFFQPEKLYWNYYLHVWKTLSYSPFQNAVVLTTAAATVDTVTVNPTAVTISVGQGAQLTATVTGDNFPSGKVTWSSNESENVTVDSTGYVNVVAKPSSGTATITATSVLDTSKKGTCTVTIP